MDKQERMRAIRNVIMELAVYKALVTVYALSVLQLLSAPLADLYESNLMLYAWVAPALIVGQGVALAEVTWFLLNRLRFARFE